MISLVQFREGSPVHPGLNVTSEWWSVVRQLIKGNIKQNEREKYEAKIYFNHGKKGKKQIIIIIKKNK